MFFTKQIPPNPPKSYLELMRRFHGKINEIVEAFNALETKTLEDQTTFKDLINHSLEVFESSLRQEFQDFIDLVNMNLGSTGNGTSVKLGTVTLNASAWGGSNNLYSQMVNIPGVTANSQVDLTPSVEQLAIFYEKDLALVAENEGGVVTVYAIGQKPENDYEIQVTITEVKE